MSDKVWAYNSRLAKRIKDELESGQKYEVGFEEHAGSQGDFIEAAKAFGLCIAGRTGYVVTVQKA